MPFHDMVSDSFSKIRFFYFIMQDRFYAIAKQRQDNKQMKDSIKLQFFGCGSSLYFYVQIQLPIHFYFKTASCDTQKKILSKYVFDQQKI